MRVSNAIHLLLAVAAACLAAPPVWGGESPPVSADRYAARLAESSVYIARSFMAPKDSVPIYCSRAERLLLEIEPTGQDDPDLLVRLGIVNGRLAEFCPKGEKVERVRRMDRYCREAIAHDSTAAEAYLLLGTLNYRLCRLSWLERMLAKAFVGELPDASLEEAEILLRRAIELQGDSPVSLYVLGRTLDAQDRLEEAIDCLEACLALEPATGLDAHYQEEAAAHLPELEREWTAIEEPWNVIEGYETIPR